MTLIGLSGKSKAGKDLFYQIYGKPRGYMQASFAYALKYKLREAFGLSLEHTDGALKDVITSKLDFHTPRELMIDYGNLIREYSPNYWCEQLFKYINNYPNEKFIITDVRYPNELDYIKNAGGYLIRLERHPIRDCFVSETTKQSVSETSLDNYTKWDLVLQAEENQIPEDLVFFGDKVDQLLLEKSK